MSSINFTNPQNVVSFCENRLNQAKVTEIIQQNRQGLSDSSSCEWNLATANYIPVLSAIWGEKDKERRLTWLQSHADKFHAPLMYEQAIAEFVKQPTVETITTLSLPLMRTASFRVQQDSACSQDPSVYNGDASLRMELCYTVALKKAMEKYTPSLKLETVQKEKTQEIQDEIKKRVTQVAKATLDVPENLPNPIWMASHGMSFFLGQLPQMHSASDYAKKREEVAKKVLNQLGG